MQRIYIADHYRIPVRPHPYRASQPWTSRSSRMETLTKLRLPHPYLTTYSIVPLVENAKGSGEVQIHAGLLQIRRGHSSKSTLPELEPPEPLHHSDFSFAAPHSTENENIPVANNAAWARARRSFKSEFRWTTSPPSTGQIWLATYALFTLRPELEQIRVSLDGPDSEKVRAQIIASVLAIPHPLNGTESSQGTDEVILQRATFWQGAGSPFGETAAWIPRDESKRARPFILNYTLTTKFPQERVHTWHPQRADKPAPGSIIYSRYIPHLDEQFSMVAIDYTNSEHLNLFHTWQNDPRVAVGWNESGDLEHHRSYLKRMHDDPHQVAMLAYFDSAPFAYFEVYWAKVRFRSSKET